MLYALMQHDLKRLLAYSTVENVGIIFIGLGLALAFRASDMGLPAALALTAALFHVLNHSMFKSLLFFGAGAVLTATGERNMEHLGGLIHRMPQTAVAFLIGCAAISALPPLNGFVSEWLTFQAILVGPQSAAMGPALHDPDGRRAARAVGGARRGLLRQGLWRGLPRPAAHAAGRSSAQEVDRFSLAAMFILAALCFIAGVLPGLVIDMLAPGGAEPGRRAHAGADLPALGVDRADRARAAAPTTASSSCSSSPSPARLTAMFIHRYATRATRRSDIWDCGYPDPSAATQYTSSSFAMPIRRVFGTTVFMVREKVDMPRPGEMRAAHFHVKVLDPAWRYLYGPSARAVMRAPVTLNQLQFLTIRSYLTLVFATLVLLLLVVAAWR